MNETDDAACAGDRSRGKTHETCLRLQFLHIGRPSSHFRCRSLQRKHPLRDFVCVRRETRFTTLERGESWLSFSEPHEHEEATVMGDVRIATG